MIRVAVPLSMVLAALSAIALSPFSPADEPRPRGVARDVVTTEAQGERLTFEITTRRGTEVKWRLETDEIVVFDCFGDIDDATIRLTGGRWPLVMLVRVHSGNLESFSAATDRQEENASIPRDWITIERVERSDGAGARRRVHHQVALPPPSSIRSRRESSS